MTASPRGITLIVNINKIQGTKEERTGSEVDEHNLCNLFTQLNFSCITKRDLSRQVCEVVKLLLAIKYIAFFSII